MIIGRQSGLGRGLGALIPPKPAPVPQVPVSSDIRPPVSAEIENDVAGEAGQRMQKGEIHHIPVDLVDPNPHQPRTHFDHAQLEDLIESIKAHGVLQPIVVTPSAGGRFELIAGERRLRASKIAGAATIPAIVRTATEQQKLEFAIIENIQRSNLNPIEEARSYLRLQNEFNLTQDEVGIRVGKSRPQVANIIRLLQLPEEIQRALAEGKISASNARTLLSLPTEGERMSMFQSMLEGGFTVRQTEARVATAIPQRARKSVSTDPNITHAEQQLRSALGAKVVIKRDARGEGEIRIAFFNPEDLGALIKKIAGEQ